MKNLSLILNGVLAVAVGVLYYLHFNTSNPSVATTAIISDSLTLSETDAVLDDSLMSLMPDSLPSAGTIAFVDSDELTSRYKFYSDGVKALENEFKKKQVELESRQKKFEEDVMRYQKLAPDMAEDARAAREKQLAQNEKSLYDFKDNLEGSLAAKQEEFSKSFMKKMDGYFKSLGKEKNYDYIFLYSKGGPSSIVFAKENLNITNITVAGLNRQYKK